MRSLDNQGLLDLLEERGLTVQHLFKLPYTTSLGATAAAAGKHVVIIRVSASMFRSGPIPLVKEGAEFVPGRVEISIVWVNLFREDKFCHVIKIILNFFHH